MFLRSWRARWACRQCARVGEYTLGNRGIPCLAADSLTLGSGLSMLGMSSGEQDTVNNLQSTEKTQKMPDNCEAMAIFEHWTVQGRDLRKKNDSHSTAWGGVGCWVNGGELVTAVCCRRASTYIHTSSHTETSSPCAFLIAFQSIPQPKKTSLHCSPLPRYSRQGSTQFGPIALSAPQPLPATDPASHQRKTTSTFFLVPPSSSPSTCICIPSSLLHETATCS